MFGLMQDYPLLTHTILDHLALAVVEPTMVKDGVC